MTTHERQLAGLGHRIRDLITLAGCVGNSAIWALAAISIASVLAAQVAPDSSNPIPVLMGAVERPDLEQEARASAPEGAFIHIYRWDGPIEPIVRYYIDHIDGHQNAPLDTAALERGRATAISYQLTFYVFADNCADSLAAPTASPATPSLCKHWRRARDLRRALTNGRNGLAPGAWVQRATWQWFNRSAQGALTHWQVDLVDSGMSEDWRHYTPRTDLTIEGVPVSPSGPK